MKMRKVTYVSLESDEGMHASYEAALSDLESRLGHRHPLFIGGKQFTTTREFAVRSPVDQEVITGHFQQAGEEEAKAAVEVARDAYPAWSRTDPAERVAAMRATATALEREVYHLAALITMEAGKTRAEAVAEVGEAVDMIRYHCDLYERADGFVVPMRPEVPGATNRSVMRPHGVWAVISPFNFPLVLAAGAAGAALLTGNTVVLKPASKTPLSGIRLYEAFVEGGVPDGAVNLVTGPGHPFGEVVTAHPAVDGIAFTGSREVGMWLMRTFLARQAYPKPVVAEMGSKNPCIVTGTADLEKAVEGVARAAFGYGGQKCSATSRVYVQHEVAEEFARMLIRRAGEIVVGDPREREVFMGPLISAQAKQTFEAAVARCRQDGGRVLAGGQVLEKGALARGFYVQPTVVAGLPESHPLMKHELFVPFLCVQPVASLDEAVRLSNDTGYGLIAGIFAEDPEEVRSFFDGIRSGVCYANRQGGATTGAWPGVQPFGGWKASGSAGKGVGGPYYLLSYLREQAQSSQNGL
ncbi:aldehyde dehydrogenase family protein [Methanofollis formosanus]|uniref:L-glutamate gamma-semialdehyde dehydrogenase n=2 Tax=Methanofollis formosanus TaxID=299308 RepID=A0A8G1A4K3_9EURY|nr:aldehyde dehydrogenase family protein [Methanofollis formosanus]